MKLVTMRYRDETRLGALITHNAQEFVLDLNRAQPDAPADIIAFLQVGDAALAAAQRAIAHADARADPAGRGHLARAGATPRQNYLRWTQ